MSAFEIVLCVKRPQYEVEGIYNKEVYLADILSISMGMEHNKDHKFNPTPNLVNFPGIEFEGIPRWKAENDKEHLQIVVGGIIRCGTKLLVLRCKNGDMKNRLTLVEGHVGFNDNPNEAFFKKELRREIAEELKIADRFLPFFTRCRLKFNTMNFTDSESLSYKHYGYIFEYVLPKEFLSKFTSEYFRPGEPNKNDVVFIDYKNPDSYKDENPDSWLIDIIDYYKINY